MRPSPPAWVPTLVCGTSHDTLSSRSSQLGTSDRAATCTDSMLGLSTGLINAVMVGRSTGELPGCKTMPTIRHPKDFFAGLLFAALGAAAIVISTGYTLGTAAHMGPGYFPRMLGILLVVIGVVLSVRALRLRGESMPAWKWRPTVIVLGSVVLFGAIVTSLGLVLSTIILIVFSSAASAEFRPREALVSSALLAAVVVGVFVFGLHLQLPIWPGSK